MDLNLSVTYSRSQGDRKYMEDFSGITYNSGSLCGGFDFLCVGIFDGHGGQEAAEFCNNNLVRSIINCKEFWSHKDEDVCEAIRKGFNRTHFAMWRKSNNWPKSPTGHSNTSGTTATLAIFRKGKVYYANVGDSTLILGHQPNGEGRWQAKVLTADHKPETEAESLRIQKCGGKVVTKLGVPRVVWHRPDALHKGPILRSTHLEEVPFLAVGRSLGDFWSYNPRTNAFSVSPVPDVGVITVDSDQKCLILATDGLWNVVRPYSAINMVESIVRLNGKTSKVTCQDNEKRNSQVIPWMNPSYKLLREATRRWSLSSTSADNITVATVVFEPQGIFRIEPKHDGEQVNLVLRHTVNMKYPRKKLHLRTCRKAGSFRAFTCTTEKHGNSYKLGSNLNSESSECSGLKVSDLLCRKRRPSLLNQGHGSNFFNSPCTKIIQSSRNQCASSSLTSQEFPASSRNYLNSDLRTSKGIENESENLPVPFTSSSNVSQKYDLSN